MGVEGIAGAGAVPFAASREARPNSFCIVADRNQTSLGLKNRIGRSERQSVKFNDSCFLYSPLIYDAAALLGQIHVVKKIDTIGKLPVYAPRLLKLL